MQHTQSHLKQWLYDNLKVSEESVQMMNRLQMDLDMEDELDARNHPVETTF